MKPGMPRNLQSSTPETSFAEKGASSVELQAPAATSSAAQRVLHSQHLFGVANEVLIEHAGFTYRLRITQANKLILTK